jgi:large subunit ribosomal protein L9
VNVILLDRIHKLGQLGETVKVKPGYGRNYLIPQGKAVPATAQNVAIFEAHRAELEKELAAKVAAAQQRATQLEALQITIPMLAAEEGKLFGSVGAGEIVDAVTALGIEAHKHEVQLPNGPFRTIGEYEVELHLHHGDVIAKVKVAIVNA